MIAGPRPSDKWIFLHRSSSLLFLPLVYRKPYQVLHSFKNLFTVKNLLLKFATKICLKISKKGTTDAAILMMSSLMRCLVYSK